MNGFERDLAIVSAWLAAHPVARGALYMLALAILGAWGNWVTWKPSAEDWARYQRERPRRAMALRISRAIFPHFRKFFPQLFSPPSSRRK